MIALAVATLACACSAPDGRAGAAGDVRADPSIAPARDAAAPFAADAASDSVTEAEPDSGSDDDAAAPGFSPDLGAIPIVDVADSPCVSPTAPSFAVTPPGASSPVFESIGTIGARYFVASATGPFFMTIANDGTAPSALVDGPLAVGAEPDALVAIEASDQGVALARFDAEAAALGAPVALTSGGASATDVAVGPSDSLAVVCDETALVARFVAHDGALGGSENWLDLGAAGTLPCEARAAWTGQAYAIVATRLIAPAKARTVYVRTTTGGAPGAPIPLLSTDAGVHLLVGVAATSAGLASLFDEGSPPRAAVLLLVDASGEPVPPALRLAGTREALSIASRGDDLAIAAARSDGRAAVRTFDAHGHPLAPWVCVDDVQPGSGAYARAAVAIDGAGLVVVAHETDGSSRVLRTDALGTGAP